MPVDNSKTIYRVAKVLHEGFQKKIFCVLVWKKFYASRHKIAAKLWQQDKVSNLACGGKKVVLGKDSEDL
jgi:hypothetical protein